MPIDHERLGREKSEISWPNLGNNGQDSIFVSVMEAKSCELSNHLGNVHMTLSDYRCKGEDGLGVVYFSQVKSASDYYPFGQLLTDGNYSVGDYRFGFQGQEMDNEIKGAGNSINFKYRMHDLRIGRFFAVDPLAKKYPYNSPYAFSENRVIDGIELEGLEYVYTADGKLGAKFGDNQTILVTNSKDIAYYQEGRISKTDLLKNSIKMSQANSEIQSNISTNIFNFYIKTMYKLYNNKISIEQDYNYPEGKQPATTSHSAQAFWLGGNTGAIALNPDATEVIDKKWNLLSDLYHEHLHNKLSSEGKEYSGAQEEVLVYVNQVAHPAFDRTADDYKKTIRANFTNNLNNLTEVSHLSKVL